MTLGDYIIWRDTVGLPKFDPVCTPADPGDIDSVIAADAMTKLWSVLVKDPKVLAMKIDVQWDALLAKVQL